METRHRRSTRGRRDQLLTLLNGWDPAGLLQSGGRRDAYSVFLDDLLGLLERDASRQEITVFLDGRTSDQFGVHPQGAEQFATKVLSWYLMESAAGE